VALHGGRRREEQPVAVLGEADRVEQHRGPLDIRHHRERVRVLSARVPHALLDEQDDGLIGQHAELLADGFGFRRGERSNGRGPRRREVLCPRGANGLEQPLDAGSAVRRQRRRGEATRAHDRGGSDVALGRVRILEIQHDLAHPGSKLARNERHQRAVRPEDLDAVPSTDRAREDLDEEALDVAREGTGPDLLHERVERPDRLDRWWDRRGGDRHLPGSPRRLRG
jgi:hypothetical protein